MSASKYHQSVLEALACSGVCSRQQLGEVEVLLRGLSGECAADAPEIWRHITARILLPSHDFAVHVRLAAAVYDGWPAAALGRPPLWLPDPVESGRTNVARFLSSVQGEAWWRAAVARWAASAGPGPDRELLLQQLQQQQQLQLQGWRQPGQPGQRLLLLQWRLLQAASWEDPEGFWPAALRELGIRFEVPPERALQRHPSDPDRCRWLPGARLNVAACALDSPRAPPGAPALLWAPDGSPRSLRPVGRQELRARVWQLAACIRSRFRIGDALAVYLPLSPDAVALYLATVVAGCVVVSVADSFSAEELRTRLDIAGAVGLFTQDVVLRGGKALPLYDKVVKSGTRARAVVLPAAEDGAYASSPPGLRSGDLRWADFLADSGCDSGSGSSYSCHDDPEQQQQQQQRPRRGSCLELPHVADAYDVTNVLFSSGTTGEPKAIPWTHLTPLRCALDGWAHLDIRPGSVVAWPTSLGWMMGPWLLYAAMINGATVAMYGGAPLGPDFLHFVEAARVDVLGLVPSIVRAWRQGGHGATAATATAAAAAAAVTHGSVSGAASEAADLSCVRVFGSTGEASAAEDYAWLMSRARGYRPVVEYCGGTEIGGGYVSSTLLHPCAPSTFTTPTLGTRLVLLAPDAAAAAAAGNGQGQGSAPLVWDRAPCGIAGAGAAHPGHQVHLSGEVALAMPMLGVSQRLMNKDHFKVYYDGMPLYGTTGLPLRRHGDEMAALPAPGPGPSPWAFAALGRCDDTMNLGGIKVSSVELERAVVEGVADVAEAAAVGLAPPQGGPEELTLFLVLRGPQAQQPPQALGQVQVQVQPSGGGNSGGNDSGGSGIGAEQQATAAAVAVLQRRCQEAVRSKLNPLFKVSRVVVVPSLPRNASNKVMRRLLRDALLPTTAARGDQRQQQQQQQQQQQAKEAAATVRSRL
ncbi:hypothetical protein PLESTB_001797100 [Pleodorina starrii]|uniref:Uncharacterized protein n=1 Tax=Pleodorina starrii TaxID=330485 RepID=A0A9W6C0J8_9CHLO|nr:hypothetical protein PLESTM_001161500 [Pleodorina starrii]GLC61734.1 hypothetical protein PLESTB_001797100 [Pleodorina starrii]GLC69214.1 hypothetical protein PLESTF_000802800 [Pleodorina starrii]